MSKAGETIHSSAKGVAGGLRARRGVGITLGRRRDHLIEPVTTSLFRITGEVEIFLERLISRGVEPLYRTPLRVSGGEREDALYVPTPGRKGGERA